MISDPKDKVSANAQRHILHTKNKFKTSKVAGVIAVNNDHKSTIPGPDVNRRLRFRL